MSRGYGNITSTVSVKRTEVWRDNDGAIGGFCDVQYLQPEGLGYPRIYG